MVFTFLLAWWWITQYSGNTTASDLKLTTTLVKQLKNWPIYKKTATCDTVAKAATTIAKWFRINLKGDTNWARAANIRSQVQTSIKQALDTKLNCDGTNPTDWKWTIDMSWKTWNGTIDQGTTSPTKEVTQPQNGNPTLCKVPEVELACALNQQSDSCPVDCRDTTPPTALIKWDDTNTSSVKYVLELAFEDRQTPVNSIMFWKKEPTDSDFVPVHEDIWGGNLYQDRQWFAIYNFRNWTFNYPWESDITPTPEFISIKPQPAPDLDCFLPSVGNWALLRPIPDDNVANNCTFKYAWLRVGHYPQGTKFKFMAISAGWYTYSNEITKTSAAQPITRNDFEKDSTPPTTVESRVYERTVWKWNHYLEVIANDPDGWINGFEIYYKDPNSKNNEFVKYDWNLDWYCAWDTWRQVWYVFGNFSLFSYDKWDFDKHPELVTNSTWMIEKLKFTDWQFIFPIGIPIQMWAYIRPIKTYYWDWKTHSQTLYNFMIPERERWESDYNCIWDSTAPRDPRWNAVYRCNKRALVACVKQFPNGTQFKIKAINRAWKSTYSDIVVKWVTKIPNGQMCLGMYRYKNSEWKTLKVSCEEGFRWCGPADNIEDQDVLENGCYVWEPPKTCEYFDNAANKSEYVSCLQWRYLSGALTKSGYYCPAQKLINGKMLELVNPWFCGELWANQWAENFCRDYWTNIYYPVTLASGFAVWFTPVNTSLYVWQEFISQRRCNEDWIEAPSCGINNLWKPAVIWDNYFRCPQWSTCTEWECKMNIVAQPILPYKDKVNWTCPAWWLALNMQWCNACANTWYYRNTNVTPQLAVKRVTIWSTSKINISWFLPNNQVLYIVRVYAKPTWSNAEYSPVDAWATYKWYGNINFLNWVYLPSIPMQIPICSYINTNYITADNLLSKNETDPLIKLNGNYAGMTLKVSIMTPHYDDTEVEYSIPANPTVADTTPPLSPLFRQPHTASSRYIAHAWYCWRYFMASAIEDASPVSIKVQYKLPSSQTYQPLVWNFFIGDPVVYWPQYSDAQMHTTFNQSWYSTICSTASSSRECSIAFVLPFSSYPAGTLLKANICSQWWCVERSLTKRNSICTYSTITNSDPR